MCEVDEKPDRKQGTMRDISEIRVYILANRGQLINKDGVISLRYFWLQNGHASKRNID